MTGCIFKTLHVCNNVVLLVAYTCSIYMFIMDHVGAKDEVDAYKHGFSS